MIFATFPHQALFQSVRFYPVGMSGGGGAGMSGAVTRVASNSGHWKAEATFLIRGEEGFLAWQGFVAQMQGMLGETLVPAWSRYLPRDGQGRQLSRKEAVSVPQLGFGDNTGFAQTDTVHARLDGAVALRDSAFRVSYDNTTGLRPGHRVGLGERYHEILSVVDRGDGTADIRVQPVLRQAYTNNTPVILDRPVCRMHFATDDEGYLPFDTSPVKSVTVNFREATP